MPGTSQLLVVPLRGSLDYAKDFLSTTLRPVDATREYILGSEQKFELRKKRKKRKKSACYTANATVRSVRGPYNDGLDLRIALNSPCFSFEYLRFLSSRVGMCIC